MGFLRKLRKAGGKLLKAGVRVAPLLASGGTLAPVTAIVGSKLRSMGENRSRMKLAEKVQRTNLGTALAVKKLSRGTNKADIGPNVPTKPNRVQELIAMRDPAVRELLTKEQAKGQRSRVVGAANRSRGAKSKWAKLDADTKDALKAEFKAAYPKGTNAQWQAFVNANA
jgi:hypothetical protein